MYVNNEESEKSKQNDHKAATTIRMEFTKKQRNSL